jgi:predicted phosphodiesterase
MTKFQIVSDLHIEYKNKEITDPLTYITPSADVIILAGDIGSCYQYDQLKTFLVNLSLLFKTVLYVPGNHEYYTMNGFKTQKMYELLDSLFIIEKSIDNLYILNRSSVQIEDTCIIGCTLWSKPKMNIPKFIVRIPEMNTFEYNKKHVEDLSYIKKMITYCKKEKLKLLVVTHHCPTFSVITTKKLNDKYISLYASDLDYILKKENVHTWIAGHIHINFDIVTKGGTRLVGNQLGKPKDCIKDYKKNMVITI